jgi:chromosome partitioning protein
MIIGVLQQKGGVGKTTLALNLAAAFAKNGLRALLVDADPQGSALAWSSVREKPPLFPVIGMPKPTLHKELPDIAKDYDVVVIDGAPRVNELARSAILASDHVLIPVQPSPFDVWSCAEIVGLVQEAQQFRPTITASFVINRKIANTAIARAVMTAFKDLPFPLLDGAITQRVAFAEAAAQGLTVVETAPSSMAALEIYDLAESLISSIKESRAA